MKRFEIILIVMIVLLALAGCKDLTGVSAPDPSAYSDEVDADRAADTDFNVNFLGIVNNLTQATGDTDTLEIGFLNGIVDASSIAENISLYPLTAASNAYAAYQRGTALVYTSEVEASPISDNSTVTLTVTSDISSVEFIEVVVSASLTAYDGVKSLNADGDNVAGETGQDDSIFYITPGGGAGAPATGEPRVPNGVWPDAEFDWGSGFSGPNIPNCTEATLPSSLTMRVGPNDFTAATLTAYDDHVSSTLVEDGIVSVSRMVDGSWTEEDITITDDADSTFTLEVSGGLNDLSFYRVISDNYNFAESSAWNGYIHRPVYDTSSTARHTSFYFYTDTTDDSATLLDIDPAPLLGLTIQNTDADALSVEIDFGGNGVTEFDSSSVTTNMFKIYNQTRKSWLTITSADIVEDEEDSIKLTIAPNNYIVQNNVSCTLYIMPGLKDLGADTTSSNDDQVLYNDAEDDYIHSRNFTF